MTSFVSIVTVQYTVASPNKPPLRITVRLAMVTKLLSMVPGLAGSSVYIYIKHALINIINYSGCGHVTNSDRERRCIIIESSIPIVIS